MDLHRHRVDTSFVDNVDWMSNMLPTIDEISAGDKNKHQTQRTDNVRHPFQNGGPSNLNPPSIGIPVPPAPFAPESMPIQGNSNQNKQPDNSNRQPPLEFEVWLPTQSVPIQSVPGSTDNQVKPDERPPPPFPNIHSIADIPKSPPPIVPGIPTPPIIPAVPNPPIMPGIPNPPVMPGVPNPPIMPGVPNPPIMPGIPIPPIMPGVPNPPIMPGVPNPPIMPEVSKSPRIIWNDGTTSAPTPSMIDGILDNAPPPLSGSIGGVNTNANRDQLLLQEQIEGQSRINDQWRQQEKADLQSQVNIQQQNNRWLEQQIQMQKELEKDVQRQITAQQNEAKSHNRHANEQRASQRDLQDRINQQHLVDTQHQQQNMINDQLHQTERITRMQGPL